MKYTQKSNQMSHSVESEEHRVNFLKGEGKGEAIAKQKLYIYYIYRTTIEVGFR